MYKRDIAILLISCIAILVSLQHEGSFSFRKAWYHSFPQEDAKAMGLYSTTKDLPPPVVADLNGDGTLEIVTVTPDMKIQVLQPQPPGRQGDGFAPARIINEVSMVYKRVVMVAGRRPVALAVGYIDPAPKERVRPLRKQVIVVVTASWQVVCFDHNLKVMWEQGVKERMPPHAHIKEVAVYVSSHEVLVGDRGLVVVGGSVERGDRGLEGGSLGEDEVLMAEMRTEEEQRTHAKSAAIRDSLSDVDKEDALKGVDVSRHFSYFALEGGTGAERWEHNSTDFHKDLNELATEMRPQVDYRLEAEKLEGRHFGEASCREYRESLLHVLPHVWSRPSDTRLEEAHFVKHRHGRGAHKEGLAVKTATRGHHGGLHSTTSSLKQATHGLLGLLASPSRLHATAGGGGGGAGRQGHERSEGGHHHGKGLHGGHNVTANALVAFLEEGVEVIHLYSGRTICKLHLPPGELHADINGDGVMDHVRVHHGEESAAELEGVDQAAGGPRHRAPQHCRAQVLAGVPPTHTLFTVPVCRSRRANVAWGSQVLTGDLPAHQATELLAPIMLPVPDTTRGYSSHRHQHGLVIFFTNKGEATAVTSNGDRLWQNFYPVSWPHSSLFEVSEAAGEAPLATPTVPTLAALPLRHHAVPSAILVAGSTSAAIISEHGNTLDLLALPHPPQQPLLVMDFNGDGLNDLVLITKDGLYGFVQVPHIGGFTLSALLLTLIMSLGIVYYTQLYDGGSTGSAKRAKKLRSTDYVD